MNIIGNDVSVVRPRFQKGWSLAFLLCALLIAAPCDATAIVVFLPPGNGSVWIAADSSLTVTDQFDNVTNRIPRCKVIDEGTFHWAAASNFYESREEGRFSVPALVSKVKDLKGKLDDKVSALIKISQAPFNREMEYIKQRQPARYAKITADPEPITAFEIVFVGVENGEPEVVWTTASAVMDGDHFVVSGKIRDLRPPIPQGGVIPLGKDDLVMMQYMRAHKDLSRTDPVALLRGTVGAAELVDSGVGGEINILRYDKDGAHWVNKSGCK